MLRFKKREPPKIFLDSSIIVAAVLSSRGGSFHLFQEAKLKKIEIYISDFVFTEVVRVLQKKYPANLSLFYKLISDVPINFIKDPSQKSVAALFKFINPDDAPILASALKSRANFLITLDRKHFLTKTIEQEHLPIIMLIPQEFLQKYWKRNK